MDWMENRRLPFQNLQDSYIDEWIAGLEQVEAELDFDILVPGHTAPGTKQIVSELHQYWLDLIAAVNGARAMGLADNSTEMIDSVRMKLAPAYGSWSSFEQFLPLNIEGLLRIGSSRLS